MNSFFNEPRAKKVWFTDDEMWIELHDARKLSIPKSYFPTLSNASAAQLLSYELSGNGIGIHFDSIDEDIYVPNLLLGIGSINSKKPA